MRLKRWSLPAAVALLAVGAAGAALEAQRPSFRTGVDLVMLNVTVTGPGGRHISDPAADDFSVFEDGRPQSVSFFSRSDTPLAVSLLIDTSSSMEYSINHKSRLDDAKLKARELLTDLPEGSKIAVFDSAETGGEWLPAVAALARAWIGGLA